MSKNKTEHIVESDRLEVKKRVNQKNGKSREVKRNRRVLVDKSRKMTVAEASVPRILTTCKTVKGLTRQDETLHDYLLCY